MYYTNLSLVADTFLHVNTLGAAVKTRQVSTEYVRFIRTY